MIERRLIIGEHIAVKCTYNDGGEGYLVGFSRVCSKDTIKRNIENGKVGCNVSDRDCKKYYKRGFKGKRPRAECYESRLFRYWKFGAGYHHTGARKGTPIPLSGNIEERKSIAVLTTRFPDEDNEEDRRINGLFKISKVDDEAGKPTCFKADKRLRLRLPLEVAKMMYFWNYYSTRGGAKWGTELIRYLDDNQVARILIDLRAVLRDDKSKGIVDEMLKDFPEPHPTPSAELTKRVLRTRKYGAGGEGRQHKKLKDWVANHPDGIGVCDVVSTEVEYQFESGDAADIVFELRGKRYAVVEIETMDPLPGAYQVLKYKVLKCAQLGSDIKSPNVEPILVAWDIPPDVKRFCQQYGIRFVEKRI